LIVLAFAGTAIAVGPGKSIEYSGGDYGKVIFNGDTHGPKQGMKCSDCHPKPFAMKKASFSMSSEDHGNADFCGKCHDGTKAFSQSNEADCAKCHKKEDATMTEEKQEEMNSEDTEIEEKQEEKE
jgi:c(7)-type cytochrome triheme protein